MSRNDTSLRRAIAAAEQRGYERGRAEGQAERDALKKTWFAGCQRYTDGANCQCYLCKTERERDALKAELLEWRGYYSFIATHGITPPQAVAVPKPPLTNEETGLEGSPGKPVAAATELPLPATSSVSAATLPAPTPPPARWTAMKDGG